MTNDTNIFRATCPFLRTNENVLHEMVKIGKDAHTKLTLINLYWNPMFPREKIWTLLESMTRVSDDFSTYMCL